MLYGNEYPNEATGGAAVGDSILSRRIGGRLARTACSRRNTAIDSGPLTRPVICADAVGATLETSFLSPTRWDGTALTVSIRCG